MKIIRVLRRPIKEYNFYIAAKKNCAVAPGHYYSPVVNTEEIFTKEKKIWTSEKELSGIDLNVEEQKELLKQFDNYYESLPFENKKQHKVRYYYENGYYSFTDAIILYCFLRHFTPKNVIEVGSGFSSALMLDTKDIFQLNTDFSFIEPYPDRLLSLLSEKDKEQYDIIKKDLQSVPLSFFKKLKRNDILFIDSTHVAKTGSDVNYIIFEILPNLESGVLIHFHDVFSSFEYPKDWVYKGRSWNEDYFLRAFLMYNNNFKIRMFSNFMHTHYGEHFNEMPLCYKNTGGNLWIEKT